MNQDRRITLLLKGIEASRYMIAEETGIPIQSVCRRIDHLIQLGKVAVLKKSKCAISGRWVEYLTSDPVKFPRNSQLKIW